MTPAIVLRATAMPPLNFKNLGIEVNSRASMKLGELKSFGHNVADSLASGICLMIGLHSVDVFQEAASSVEGFIEVDFLNGELSGSASSSELRATVDAYLKALPGLCSRHGLDSTEIESIRARFATDQVYGRHYTVTISAKDGRCSTARYIGIPGRRLRTRILGRDGAQLIATTFCLRPPLSKNFHAL